MGSPSDNPRFAERAALMNRAAKRAIDREELTGLWQRQAADLGFGSRFARGRGRGCGAGVTFARRLTVLRLMDEPD